MRASALEGRCTGYEVKPTIFGCPDEVAFEPLFIAIESVCFSELECVGVGEDGIDYTTNAFVEAFTK